MSKEQVVELMTNFVIDVNREELSRSGQIDPNTLEEMIQQAIEPIYMMNSRLYDLLEENGVVA